MPLFHQFLCSEPIYSSTAYFLLLFSISTNCTVDSFCAGLAYYYIFGNLQGWFHNCASFSLVQTSILVVLNLSSCNIQALDLLEMLKKEEEMLSAIKERQSKVVYIKRALLIATAQLYTM